MTSELFIDFKTKMEVLNGKPIYLMAGEVFALGVQRGTTDKWEDDLLCVFIHLNGYKIIGLLINR